MTDTEMAATITDHYNQLHFDEKTLWRLACDWQNTDPTDKSIHLSKANPFTLAWRECSDRKKSAIPVPVI